MAARLAPIESRRLYQQISDLLRRSIDDGSFAVGSYLPPERELAEQLQVSRTSVREALIALEVEGRVSVRVGAGVQVLARPAQVAAALPQAPIGPLDLLDARLLVESQTAALAARQAGAADIARLEQWSAQMVREHQKRSREHVADRGFHLEIARIAANAALEMIVAGLWDARRTPLQDRFESIFSTSERFDATERDHEAILEAIRAQDAAAARAAMRRHLVRVRRTLAREIGGR